MLKGLSAAVLAFSLALPASAGTGKVQVNVGNAGVGGAASVGAVGAPLSGAAPLTLLQSGFTSPTALFGDVLGPAGSLQGIPTAVLADALRQNLPQVTAAVAQTAQVP